MRVTKIMLSLCAGRHTNKPGFDTLKLNSIRCTSHKFAVHLMQQEAASLFTYVDNSCTSYNANIFYNVAYLDISTYRRDTVWLDTVLQVLLGRVRP